MTTNTELGRLPLADAELESYCVAMAALPDANTGSMAVATAHGVSAREVMSRAHDPEISSRIDFLRSVNTERWADVVEETA
ncbi:hypothetical protein BAJUN_01550 [Bajunvirus bajun]|uniref:Uncharacterized protein n=1 Tax=Brevundimonas phage vB_BgoS-Bajun TaxID=2948594 RepID=A0A9E7N6B6_9CAUD|nr:hypothetical protein BAJUN_01550 [Brevundimonas phage vB_BgoS-Bajun]